MPCGITVLPATRQRWESRLYFQPKQVLDLANSEGCKAELTYITWKPTGWELNTRSISRKSNALPLSHHATPEAVKSGRAIDITLNNLSDNWHISRLETNGNYWFALCTDGQIQRLGSELLGLVLLKTLLMKTSADESNQTYTVYVTLTSVSRAWRRTIIGQPWFQATPTQPNLLPSDDDGTCRVCVTQRMPLTTNKIKQSEHEWILQLVLTQELQCTLPLAVCVCRWLQPALVARCSTRTHQEMR